VVKETEKCRVLLIRRDIFNGYWCTFSVKILVKFLRQPTEILKQIALDICHTSERILSEMLALLIILRSVESQKSADLIDTTVEASNHSGYFSFHVYMW
jgi:hypothetical protein